MGAARIKSEERRGAHLSGTFGGIVGVYQHHDFLPERRHALNLWATHVEGLTIERESNVVPLIDRCA